MRRIVPPLAVAILALAAGCADNTSPAATARTVLSPTALIGNPPPPPSDTGSYTSTAQGSFYLQAIYFMNPTEKSGFVHFNTTQPAGVIISPDASIDYHLGTVSGVGTITAPVTGGTITIDLTQVSGDGAYWTGDCSKSCAQIPVAGTFTDSQSNTSTPTTGFLTVGVSSRVVTAGT